MATIQDFRDTWADRSKRDSALELAELYVNENEDTLGPILADKSSDDCVQLVELARLAGNDDLVTTVTMWELVKFPRKDITGSLVPGRPMNG
jgi:hypothetical protein